MAINFNTSPYFDDYNEDKKFLKILYRPGVAVQTRELNQIQSQIQKQIERFGEGIYKHGSMVIPGGISYNKSYNYVRLTGILNSAITVSGSTQPVTEITENIEESIKLMIGKQIVGDTSGVTGIVKWYQLETDTTPLTLFVEYDSSGTDNESAAFNNSETLTVKVSETDQDNYEEYIVTTAISNSTGLGSAAEINRGVYFIDGYFVLVSKQTLILDAYSTTPSYRVGLRILESIVTPDEDSSLNDNANGTFNFAAPGAHRYMIDLVLEKIALDTEADDTFVELLQVKDGIILRHVDKTVYSEISKEFARRTYDESGDYTVSAFRMSAIESRNNDRGTWAPNTSYLIGDIVVNQENTYVAVNSGTSGSSAPTHAQGDVTDGNIVWSYTTSPNYNNGHSLTGDPNQLLIAVEPGKAYVRGYEIEKPSTTYLAIDKAREYEQIDNDVIKTEIGNYIRVRDITGVPDVVTFSKVDLMLSNETVIGSARIRHLQKFGSVDYHLYLFDVVLNDNYTIDRDVKIIGNNSFSCVVTNMVMTEAIGSITSNLGTITGIGTRFLNDFKVNDFIEIDGDYFRIAQVTDDKQLVVDGIPDATNDTYRIHRTYVQLPSRTVSLFPLGRSFIKSVKDESDGSNNIDMSYVVMQKVTKTIGTTTLSVSLSEVTGLTGVGAEIFANPEDIILCDDYTDTSGDFEPLINVTSSNSVITDTSITVNGLIAGRTYTIFFPVVKNTVTTAAPKTKTLVRNASISKTTAADYEQRVILLNKADVYRIRKVEMEVVEGSNVTTVDITDYFDLDNGQRDTHYDLGRIIRKPGYGIPTGELTIYFDYFEHSQTGDYFSIDSYVDVRREDIPQYSSIYGIVYLSDVLDFRPRISDDGTSFVGTGAKLALPPKPGTRTEVDYTYYLPRIDKISLDVEGKFIVTSGKASEVATEPKTPDMAMHMATVTLAPYTYNPLYATIKKIDNRRYTMRDIGKIEKRLENLEYYTSLSLLEQQASSLNIPDENGFNRFKNGFIVDNFSGHNTGDVASPDYKASIDMEMKELRPTFTMDNVNLIEKAKTDAERQSQGYKLTGDIVTLPYTENEFIYQRYASKPENVNPFAIFTFIGTAELNPPSDEWIETQRIPEIINDVEGNYSSVLNAQRESGALGTIWNSWQTQWTGTQVTGTSLVRATDWSKQDFGLGAGRWMGRDTFTAAESQLINSTAGGRVLTYEIIATQTGQTRTGINTDVRATFSKEFVNDRLVSTSVVPFIRSRKVSFVARGLKLNTLVYPFFDEVSISNYITPASRLSYIDDVTFDYETNVGQDNDEVSRRIDGNVQTAYNKGDVVYVSRRNNVQYDTPENSVATAVVLLQEIRPGSNTKSILLIPTKGTFLQGDVITGTVSGSEATVVLYEAKSQGDDLVTNFSGDVAGVFDIPNTDSLRFKTGNREFKLIDNSSNNDLIAKTRAFASYHAEGALQTWQATYNSVRNAEVVRTVVTEDRTIVTDERAGRLIRDTGWYDPLAQTFLIENRGGAFITSVDIWFASIDPVKPITMQIREVVNGYPGKNILPFSTVTLYPHELSGSYQPLGYGLSSNTIEVDGTTWLAPDTPTKFKMKAPVYVQDVGEYCVVLLSNSNNYNVWTSELGGIDVTTSTPKLISEQPYAGVLFKSQNASTWTAHQNEDLMFRINVAEFESQGSVEFVNARLDTVMLEDNPIFFRKNSPLARIFHNNHGFYVGAKVNLQVEVGTYNGITSNIINGEHTIEHVEQDAYVIRLTGAVPSVTGRTCGQNVKVTRNIKYDVLQPIVQLQNFSDTSLSFSARTTSGKSINGEQVAGTLSSYVSLNVNENNEFYTPRMIASPENETGDKSFFLKATMQTSNPSLSPVIDTARTSLITVSNRVDNPTLENMNYVDSVTSLDFDIYNLFTTSVNTIAFSGNTITTTNADVKAKFKTLRPGKYITITGGLNSGKTTVILKISDDATVITVADTLITQAAGTSLNIRVYDNFIDEVALNGSSSAKYLTRKINLAGAAANSTSIDVRFAADIPPGAFVDIYYKIAQVGDSSDFSELNWVKMNTATTTNGLTDLSFSASDLPEFNSVAVKLVMKSTNSALIPRAKDLIVIAAA